MVHCHFLLSQRKKCTSQESPIRTGKNELVLSATHSQRELIGHQSKHHRNPSQKRTCQLTNPAFDCHHVLCCSAHVRTRTQIKSYTQFTNCTDQFSPSSLSCSSETSLLSSTPSTVETVALALIPFFSRLWFLNHTWRRTSISKSEALVKVFLTAAETNMSYRKHHCYNGHFHVLL